MIIEFSIIILSAVRQNLISLFTTICLPCSCFRCLIWRNDKWVNYNSFEFSWRLFKEVILAGNCTNWWVSICCAEEELNGERIISSVKRFPDIKQINSNKKEEENVSAELRIKTILLLFDSRRTRSTLSLRRMGDPQGRASDWRIGVIMLFLHTSGGSGCSSFIHQFHPVRIGSCCHSLGTSGCIRVNQMQQCTSCLRVLDKYSCFHSFLLLLVYQYIKEPIATRRNHIKCVYVHFRNRNTFHLLEFNWNPHVPHYLRTRCERPRGDTLLI